MKQIKTINDIKKIAFATRVSAYAASKKITTNPDVRAFDFGDSLLRLGLGDCSFVGGQSFIGKKGKMFTTSDLDAEARAFILGH